MVIDIKVTGTTTITQGFHQTLIVETTIVEPSLPGFLMVAFPNPTIDFVALKIEKGEIQNLEFALFDAHGKFLLKERLTAAEHKVSFDQLNTGNYIIKILKNDREVQSFKIIKMSQ